MWKYSLEDLAIIGPFKCLLNTSVLGITVSLSALGKFIWRLWADQKEEGRLVKTAVIQQ